jgi:predicted HicB family RNase H-like nuclease
MGSNIGNCEMTEDKLEHRGYIGKYRCHLDANGAIYVGKVYDTEYNIIFKSNTLEGLKNEFQRQVDNYVINLLTSMIHLN